jgi:hypothetical protein
LTGHIGTASAKILISSVVKEDKISLPEVLILEESKENIIINKKLTDSNELKNIRTTQNANQVNKDIQKMNFWIRLPMN